MADRPARTRRTRLTICGVVVALLLPLLTTLGPAGDPAAAQAEPPVEPPVEPEAAETVPDGVPPGSVQIPYAVQLVQRRELYWDNPDGPDQYACLASAYVVIDDAYANPYYSGDHEVTRYYEIKNPGEPNEYAQAEYAGRRVIARDGGHFDGLVLFSGPPDFGDRGGFDEWYGYEHDNSSTNGCGTSIYATKVQRVFDTVEGLELWTDGPPGGFPNRAPVADFDWTQSETVPTEVQFTDRSSDPDGDPLDYAWEFDHDGATSDERNPLHTFPFEGSFDVSLTVTDPDGETDTATQTVRLNDELIVNSTGDSGATDPAEDGCDTGGTVGSGAPECTLRAALEVLEAEQSGPEADAEGPEIRFDIEGAGVPTIGLTGALPDVVGTSVTIDGTTQAAEQVAIDGGGLDGPILRLAGPAARVTGLVLDDAAAGIELAATGATVEGNVFGADPTGMTPGSLDVGVRVSEGGADAVVAANQITGLSGVTVSAPGATVEDNVIGVDAAGAAALGDTVGGVLTRSPDTTISGNTVRAEVVAILVVTADATGAQVTDNRVGVADASATPLADQGRGIRIDGAPGATVSGNVVVADGVAEAGIEVIGGVQTTQDDEGNLFLNSSVASDETPVTGGSVTVAGNVVGAAAIDAEPVGDVTPNGILVWDEAPEVTLSANTVAGVGQRAVKVEGGAGHRIVGNHLGVDTGGDAAAVPGGIDLFATPDTVVGEAGAGNDVLTEGTAVTSTGPSSLTVAGNDLTHAGGEDGRGVFAGPGTSSTIISDNVVAGFPTAGVTVRNGTTEVTGNEVSGADPTVEVDPPAVGALGIDVTVDEASVEDNSVVATTTTALVVDGEDGTVEDNLVGVTSAGGPVTGNEGDGIVLAGGPVAVTGNDVVGTVGTAIDVEGGVDADLRGNRIEGTDGTPIAVAGGTPAPPTIEAVVQTGSGESLRTTLLVSDLPADATGRVEVFANDDCADAEAEEVLGIVRTKAPGAEHRIIQLIERPNDDHFTATWTSEGRTSALSACASVGSYDDDDDDGSPDPFDDLIGGAGDPTRSVVVTDEEQLLGISVAPPDGSGFGGGTITSAGPGPDPDPTGHPDGFSLAYGVIGFTIEGVEQGGTTGVVITHLDGPSGTAGDTYWKYGPQTPGGPSTWFEFTFDEATGTGAVPSAVDVPGFGIRRSWNVVLTDGQRGDSTGPDGTIVDPGGPGFTCGRLTDVPRWAEEGICWLMNEGHATGYRNNTFRPDLSITRAQVARMLYRITAATPTDGDCGNLTDVPTWAADAICWLMDEGHATGYPGNTFQPDRSITRAQVARMLYRITAATPTDGPCGNLTDVPDWADDAICWLMDEGHATGYPGNTFRPNLSITRAQVARMLYRIFT